MTKRPSEEQEIFKKILKTNIQCSGTMTESNSSQPKCSYEIKESNENASINITNVEHLPTPIKSLNDKKDYGVIRLPNGLTAILIGDSRNSLTTIEEIAEESDDDSDGTTTSESITEESEDEDEIAMETEVNQRKKPKNTSKMAAAALCVNVGSFSDSREIPGMAHFLEHMVFMGSEKYPKENAFDSFVKTHGGEDNASTGCEVTSFYFDCRENHFQGALDRFAQFFIAPLMKREAMTRERKAIQSEFQMALPEDDCRMDQLLALLAKKDNPCTNFTWGNMETLRDNVKDDDLYAAVHKFRERHYSAHRMTLAVEARLPLSVLESYVVKYFSDIPNNGLSPVDLTGHLLAFDTPEFRSFYRVKPVSDIRVLELSWPLPPLQEEYKSKPDEHLKHLIGHEGKGSLISFLKKKIWVLSAYASTGSSDLHFNSMYTLLTITLNLTTQGLAHVKEVGEAVFGYLSMLRLLGPSERVHNEMKMISDICFRYEEEADPFDMVQQLASNLVMYPPEDCITGSDLLVEYKPQLIQDCLNLMVPSTVNVMVLNDSGEFDREEHWFKTKYSVCAIPEDWLKCWEAATPNARFHLPEPNVFVPTNFSMVAPPTNITPYPIILLSDEQVEMWYRYDDKFKRPFTHHYYYFITPLATASVKSATLMDLYITILDHMLMEEMYPALMANFIININKDKLGMVLKVSGYSHKVDLVLKAVVHSMLQFDEYLTEELFSAIKEKECTSYYNKFIRPTRLVAELRRSVLFKYYWTSVEKHDAISSITMQDLKNFSKLLFKEVYVQGLVQGNISKTEVIHTWDYITKTLQCGILRTSPHPESRVNKIPLGKKCLRVKSFNPDDTNSIVCHYYQAGQLSMKDSCILTLLLTMMEEPVFDVLRTQEQLGYWVSCSDIDTTGVKGFTVVVNYQADKNSADMVDGRIEEFLKYFYKHLGKLSKKEIEVAKQSLIEIKRLANLSLTEEADINWHEIMIKEYHFERFYEEATLIEGITRNDILTCLQKYTCQKGTKKFSIQVVGNDKMTRKSRRPKVSVPGVRKHSKTKVNSHSQQRGKKKSRRNIVKYDEEKKYSVEIISKSNLKKGSYFISNIEEFKNSLKLYPNLHEVTSRCQTLNLT